jgi:hypothetical protein
MVERTPNHRFMGSRAMPELDFGVEDARAAQFAAVPTLNFLLRLTSPGSSIRSIALRTQIRIAVARRPHDAATQERLMELFGHSSSWANTVRSLPWADATVNVGGFEETILVEVPVVCTYDFEVTAAKYLHSLNDGMIPLEFLFSGTVFYDEGGSLRVIQIPWEKEATYELPVSEWRSLIDRYFPDTGWLRVRRDVFDRLYAYRARNALLSWERTLEALLDNADGKET